MLGVFPEEELCIFYLLLQIKTRYPEGKRGEEKEVGQRPHIKIVQYDLTVLQSYEGRGVG